MNKKVILSTRNISITVKFDNTPVSLQILEKFPVSSKVNTWGEEIYFRIPALDLPETDGTTSVEIGDVAFWPEGNCLCLFFGRTPISTSEKPLPASEVLLVGKVTGGLEKLGEIRDGDKIRVEKM